MPCKPMRTLSLPPPPPPPASRRFAEDAHDDVADFSGEQAAELVRWREFYSTHKVRSAAPAPGLFLCSRHVRAPLSVLDRLVLSGVQCGWSAQGSNSSAAGVACCHGCHDVAARSPLLGERGSSLCVPTGRAHRRHAPPLPASSPCRSIAEWGALSAGFTTPRASRHRCLRAWRPLRRPTRRPRRRRSRGVAKRSSRSRATCGGARRRVRAGGSGARRAGKRQVLRLVVVHGQPLPCMHANGPCAFACPPPAFPPIQLIA
jgi:hypothetical protein